MRSILFQQPGVLDAGADWQAGTGWVIYNPDQVTSAELATALSAYYPAQVAEDSPVDDNQQTGGQ